MKTANDGSNRLCCFLSFFYISFLLILFRTLFQARRILRSKDDSTLNRLEELLRHAELRLPLLRCTERERIADLVRTVTGWTADAEKLMARRGPERLTIDAAQALLDKVWHSGGGGCAIAAIQPCWAALLACPACCRPKGHSRLRFVVVAGGCGVPASFETLAPP